MEAEVEGRVKPLPYKVRSVSRESAAQKAAHVLDSDLRTHWSTSTNTKEWLVLELEESCLLSHIRIHNKSVLEWEISIGLRFKPDTYLKVRPRCEAPRRDVTYHIGYQPCCFIRVSCLRGNPIAIFHIQLMGIPVPGLEPELQPVVDQVLPHIIAHIRDPHDIYLQLLQDIASRLSAFLPQLEGELGVSNEVMETSIRFFAMLVGPFYPILTVVGGRENDKPASGGMEADSAKSNQATVFTVSSNFQAPPKRVRSPGLSQQPAGHALALRPEAVLLLLRVAYKDNSLGNVCRKVARILRRLNGSSSSGDNSLSVGETAVPSGGSSATGLDDGPGSSETAALRSFVSDYSSIFGEDFRPYDDDGLEINHLGILDVAAVEEGFLHVLYACASQPVMCRRLADSKSDLIPVLPFIQAIIPALRPPPSMAADADQVDETFWQWQAPTVQRAVTQVVALSTSPSYRPLLDACAGYLSSYSLAHEKAACVLIDLCAGPLAPWLPMVVAKVDLAIELLGDLLGIIQAGHQDTSCARAALVYLMLALSGNVDDVLAQYKDVKHHVLFLIEMLEPFLIPAISPVKSTIAFGDVSAVLLGKQEQTCALALDLLHTAIKKPAVLPAIEAEWRRGHVTPSVLLSILAPHVQLPPGIDLRRSSRERSSVHDSVPAEESSGTFSTEIVPKSSTTDDEGTNKGEYTADVISKSDTNEDPNFLFAPIEVRSATLPSVTSRFEGTSPDSQKVLNFGAKVDGKVGDAKSSTVESKFILDRANGEEYFNLQAEYLQLVNSQERELRAMEFIHFATELHSRPDASKESHQAAIDALLLAAECHLNPFFMVSSTVYQQQVVRFLQLKDLVSMTETSHIDRSKTEKSSTDLEVVLWLEEARDKAVLRILLEAAEWDSSVEKIFTKGSSGLDSNSVSSCRVHIFKEDAEAEDAITLVREHQGLLCSFLIHQLRRERHNMYEVLLQGLLIILDSATRLSSPPKEIIEVILQCAERLNSSLVLFYSQVSDGTVVPEAVAYCIRRQWALLRRLVLVASGGRSSEEEDDLAALRGSMLQTALIPAWAWMSKIPEFSSASFPLVRYVGWMALSRYAKFYKENGLLLVSDVQQLTSLLLVFSDELSSVNGWKLRKRKGKDVMVEAAYRVATGNDVNVSRGPYGDLSAETDLGGLVKALYPELDLVFPQLRTEFSQFADAMLESVCQVLKAVPSTTIPDLLSWFSEICLEPFPAAVKGYGLANVKYVIVYLLEVVVVEHMEAIVPELPRVLEVLISLCSSSYCDVPLLESVISVLKPVISHATSTVASVEDYSQALGPGATFESLCFDAMTEQLRAGTDGKEPVSRSGRSLLLYLAGSLLSDLSVGRRIELISSFMGWVNFTAANPTSVYYNYLRAFQKILEECTLLLQNLLGEANCTVPEEKQTARKSATQALFALTAPSFSPPPPTEVRNPVGLEAGAQLEEFEAGENGTPEDEGVLSLSENQDDSATTGEAENETTLEDEQGSVDDGITSQDLDMKSNSFGSSAEIEEFKQKCTDLTLALGPAIEVCWRIHPCLCRKVSKLAAKCLYYASFEENHGLTYGDGGAAEKDTGDSQVDTSGVLSEPLEVLAQKVKKFQEAHCWQVATVTMDLLLSLPSASSAAGVLKEICAVLQYQCTHAPRVAWRLQTSKWLVKALSLAGKGSLSSTSIPLIELLCGMLEHSEPEQRLGALQQLGKLISSDLDNTSSSDISADDLLNRQSQDNFTQKRFAHVLVASTWERVTSTAACDPSLGLRKEALELLLKFVPLAEPTELQSFLRSSDGILPGLTTTAATINSGPLTRLALMVLSRTCLYSSASDISTIPARVWNSVELMANAKAGGLFAEAERSLCQALLQLREHGDAAKQSVWDILSGKGEKFGFPSNFAPVREAVLEVLARLGAVWSKEDSIAAAAEELSKEVEEAEIELKLLSQEKSLHKADGSERVQERVSSIMSASISGFTGDSKERLKQLKTQIMAEEHTKTYALIAARREKQRIARRDRQLALEKAALRKIELLQELDRERAAEAEREIERQKTLEKERAKTREMRHNLELEAERRSQREFQREMEQRESGAMRSSRREFATATTPSSRPRERYRERERESGRTGQEGGSTPRPSAAGGGPLREGGITPPATPTAAAGTPTGGGGSSRSSYSSGGFSQVGRDRDDRGGYEESTAEGSGSRGGGGEMTGDGNNSFGDIDGGGSSLDAGTSGNVASGHRQSGPRTTRPTRQIVERRERDGRREGKWERKQT